MDINKLIALVTILITLSLASERLIEIVKGFFPYLNEPQPDDAPAEARRKAWIHILAVTCGMITAFLASPILAGVFQELTTPAPGTGQMSGITCPNGFRVLGFPVSEPCGLSIDIHTLPVILALGLLASGGSGLWNSVLEYLLKIKELKKTQLEREKIETLRTKAAVNLEVEESRLAIKKINESTVS